MLSSILGILLCLLLSAFFSGTEIAYSSASELRLRQAAENGGKRQNWAYWIYSRYNNALTTILIGNNLVNNAASAMATVIVMNLLGAGYAWVSTLVMTVLVLIFGEIVPKVIAKEIPEKFSTAVSPILRGLMWLTYPIVWLVQAFIRLLSRFWRNQPSSTPAVTEGDIEVLLDTAEDEGAIDENTSELLLSALEFDDEMAYEIITPRVDVLAIDIEDSMEDIIATVLRSSFSRLPVYEDNKDNIIGILNINRFMKVLADGVMAHDDLRDMLMPVCFVSRTAVLPAVLATMRQRKCHMVVVGDEFGGTLGILTMEDILEELVGDIWDETDEVHSEFSLLADGRYEASGDLRLHDFFEHLDIDDRHVDADSTTLGGWASEMLGTTPKLGDSFTFEGLEITVSKVIKRRVTRVSVTQAVPPETVQTETA